MDLMCSPWLKHRAKAKQTEGTAADEQALSYSELVSAVQAQTSARQHSVLLLEVV